MTFRNAKPDICDDYEGKPSHKMFGILFVSLNSDISVIGSLSSSVVSSKDVGGWQYKTQNLETKLCKKTTRQFCANTSTASRPIDWNSL